MDGEGDATIGRDQCEQETSSALCGYAAGTETSCSFTVPTPPLNPNPPPAPQYNHDELDPIISSSKASRAWWVSVLTLVTMKTFLYSIWLKWKINQNCKNKTPQWVSVGKLRHYFQLLNAGACKQRGFCTNSSKSWPCEEVFCIINIVL